MAGRPENLKPFKPGQSGNPEGGRKHRGVGKRMKQLSREELKDLGDLILLGKLDKLQQIGDEAKHNPKKHSVLKVWVASIAVKAIVKGDMGTLDTLLNRLIGPVPKDVHVSNPDGSMRPQVVLTLPDNGRSIESEDPIVKHKNG